VRAESGAGPFDPDHVGAVVGEQHRRERPRPDPAELDNADAGERAGH
jgi:hypothetical protein